MVCEGTQREKECGACGNEEGNLKSGGNGKCVVWVGPCLEGGGNRETEPWHRARWKPWGEVEWSAVNKSLGPLMSKLSPPLPHTMASAGGLLSVSSQTLLLLGKKLRIRAHPLLALLNLPTLNQLLLWGWWVTRRMSKVRMDLWASAFQYTSEGFLLRPSLC